MEKLNKICKVVAVVCLVGSLFVALLPCFTFKEEVLASVFSEYSADLGIGDMSGTDVMSLLDNSAVSELTNKLNDGLASNMLRSSVIILGGFVIVAYSYSKYLALLYFLLFLIGVPVMTIIASCFQLFGKNRNKKVVSCVLIGVNLLFCISVFIAVPNFCISIVKEILTGMMVTELNGILSEVVRTLVVQIMFRSMSIGFWGFVVLQLIALACAVYRMVKGDEAGEAVLQSVSKVAGKLFGVTGAYAGAELAVEAGGIIMGRDAAEAQLIIDSPKVSRRHCRVVYDNQKKQYIVTDYSSNGTFVGNRRLTKGVAEILPVGTVIALGDNKNTFRLQ